MIANKLEILDKIIETEDDLENKLMSQIPDRVIETIKSLYGDDGVAVAKVYYKQDDNESPNELDCPDCEKKAKQLIEIMKIGQTITESLSNEKTVDLLKHISEKCNLNKKLNEVIDCVSKIVDREFSDIKITGQIIKLCLVRELITNRQL